MRPVSMKDGEFAKQIHTEWGVYNVSCFEKVPGESLENVNGTLEIAKGYGYTLGNLHALLKEYPHSENRRDHRALLDEISCRIQKYDAPETVKRELLAVSKEIPVSASDYGIVHYDFEPDNVFYDAEPDSFSVIDFDDAISYCVSDEVWGLRELARRFQQLVKNNTKRLVNFGMKCPEYTEGKISEALDTIGLRLQLNT